MRWPGSDNGGSVRRVGMPYRRVMHATLIAGVPSVNRSLYHRVRFAAPDPAAWLELPDGSAVFVLRDIEVARARRTARADRCLCPADVLPSEALSGDRETATAQAVVALLGEIREVVADRTLPLLTAEVLREAGVTVTLDPELGVRERRAKDAQELRWLREAQAGTEAAVRRAGELIHDAAVAADGTLTTGGGPLTGGVVRRAIRDVLEGHGLSSQDGLIVAGGPEAGDCHEPGDPDRPLRAGEPVIADVFPRGPHGYVGDCTRTFCHGTPPDWLRDAHAAVVAAKAAACGAVRAGVTGRDVHAATTGSLAAAGYAVGPAADPHTPTMPHGTGHGVGLDVHEAPLLDAKGGELVAGDVVTVEPGLYAPALGGVRVEDMLLVTEDGSENLNTLDEGL